MSLDGNRILHDAVYISWNLTSIFDSNGIYLIVREPPDDKHQFTTRVILDKSSQSICNLKSDTLYSITVMATFNCRNVTGSVDFTTKPYASSDDSWLPPGDCIKYEPTRQES